MSRYKCTHCQTSHSIIHDKFILTRSWQKRIQLLTRFADTNATWQDSHWQIGRQNFAQRNCRADSSSVAIGKIDACTEHSDVQNKLSRHKPQCGTWVPIWLVKSPNKFCAIERICLCCVPASDPQGMQCTCLLHAALRCYICEADAQASWTSLLLSQIGLKEMIRFWHAG